MLPTVQIFFLYFSGKFFIFSAFKKILFENRSKILLARPSIKLFSYITNGMFKNLEANETGKDT